MKKISYFIFALALSMQACQNSEQKQESEHKQENSEANTSVKLTQLATNEDLVCKMKVKEGKIADTTMYNGKMYAFCSTTCKENFAKNPTNYLKQ